MTLLSDFQKNIDVKKLIDEIYILERAIENNTLYLKKRKQDLVCAMAENGIDKGYGSHGIGYQLSKAPARYEYKPAAIEYLDLKDCLQFFIDNTPKITRTKLKELLDEGRLTYADIAEIEKHTISTEGEVIVRKIVDKEYQKEALSVS
jgi:hypothetical protein